MAGLSSRWRVSQGNFSGAVVAEPPPPLIQTTVIRAADVVISRKKGEGSHARMQPLLKPLVADALFLPAPPNSSI